jgi:hypothetical protein
MSRSTLLGCLLAALPLSGLAPSGRAARSAEPLGLGNDPCARRCMDQLKKDQGDCYDINCYSTIWSFLGVARRACNEPALTYCLDAAEKTYEACMKRCESRLP